MSRTIDERIVDMQFNNRQFEEGIKNTMKSMDDLKSGLDGMTGKVGDASDKVGLSFSAMQVVAATALAKLTDSIIDFGTQTAKSLGLDPIIAGFAAYEQQIASTKGIMNATRREVEDVENALKPLIFFADETSFSFQQMIDSVRLFTGAGIELEDSVTAMQGIGSASALAGVEIGRMETVFDALSKSIGMGVLRRREWDRLQMAGLGTSIEFKEILIDTAVAMGTLEESSGKFYTLTADSSGDINKAEVSIGNLSDTLKENWVTTEVMMEVFGEFGSFAQATFELVEETGMLASDAMSQLSTETQHFSERGMRAAQEARTLTDTLEAISNTIAARWRETFRLLVGNVDEATELWTDVVEVLWDLFVTSGDVRNEVLSTWRALGATDDFPGLDGRAVLLEGLANIGRSLLAVIEAIQEAWSNIFPPMTAEKLYEITENFRDFTERLIISEETVDKLRRVFEGLFAALDLARMGVSAIFQVMGRLIGAFSPVGAGLFDITVGIADFIVALREAVIDGDIFGKGVETIGEILDGVRSVIQRAAENVREWIGKLGEYLQGFSGIDLGALKIFSRDVEIAFTPFTFIANVFKKAFEVVVAVFQWAVPLVEPLARKLGEAFSNFGAKIGEAVRSGDLKALLDLVNTGLLGSLIFGIRKFIDSLTGITKGASGALDSIQGILDGVRGSLEAYQQKLKADTLLVIAGAIALLAGSILILSTIDTGAMATSLAAISVLFVELTAVLVVLDKQMGALGVVKMGAIGAQMVALSAAILILSFAMKNIASLDWEGLMKGAVGLANLAGILIAASHAMSQNVGRLTTGGLGLIAFATALLILTQAVKSLSELDVGELAKGLIGVGIMMGEIAAFSHLVKPEKLMSTGLAMIAMGTALNIMASAVRSFGALSLEELAKGLGGISVALVAVAGFTQIVKPEKLMSTGLAMIAMGAALNIMASAVEKFGSMDLEDLASGLAGMGAALVAIAAFTQVINTQKIFTTGVAMIALSTALLLVAQAVKMFGGMSWEELARGLIGLGGAILVLAVGANAMTGALGGAAAMVVMATAIAILVPPLMLLGMMDLANIGLALLALAGTFTVVGVAGLVLGPLVPIILGLAGAIALLGVGVLAIGAGLLAFAAGITALALAGTAGAAALGVFVNVMIGFVPSIAAAIGRGLIEVVKVLIDGMDVLMDGAKAIFMGLLGIIREMTPPTVETLLEFINTLLRNLADAAPEMMDSGMRLLLAILEGLRNHIGDIVVVALEIVAEFLRGLAEGIPGVIESAVDIIVAFMDTIGNETPRIIDAGFKMTIDFINGLADAIRENTPVLVEAFWNLAAAMIEGLVAGLFAGIDGAVGAAIALGESMIKGVKDVLGIASPSKVFEEEVGRNIALGTAKGIDDNASKSAKAAKKMADDAYNAAKSWIQDYRNDVEYMASEEMKMWEVLAESYEAKSKERIEIDKSIRALQDQIAREKAAAEKEEFENSKMWMEREKRLREMTLNEELSHWERVQARYSESSEARQRADQEIFNTFMSRAKDRTTAIDEEYEIWEFAQTRYLEGSIERQRIDEELESVRQRIYENQVQNIEKIDKLEADYANSVESRTSQIVGAWGMFTEVKEKDQVAGEDLIKNLQDQVNELDKWADNLTALAKRGVDEGLISELQKMGPSANTEIDALTKMTDKQLAKYEELWVQKHERARSRAVEELIGMREDIDNQIEEIQVALTNLNLIGTGNRFIQAGEESMDGLISGYEDKAPELHTVVANINEQSVNGFLSFKPKYQDTGKHLGNALIQGWKDRQPETVASARTTTTAALGEVSSHGPQFHRVGQNLTMSMVDGILSRIGDAVRAGTEIARAAHQAAMDEAEIRSPSRKFFKIGEFCAIGLANGLEAYAFLAEDAAVDMGEDMIRGFNDIVSTISDVIDMDLDLVLVIRPVIDMTDIESGISDISNMFERKPQLNLTGLVNMVGSVSRAIARPEREAFETSGEQESDKIFTFTQNNYSPAALSRIDIYRQTRNQFSAFRGVLD